MLVLLQELNGTILVSLLVQVFEFLLLVFGNNEVKLLHLLAEVSFLFLELFFSLLA
jgi:hypothetical protein